MDDFIYKLSSWSRKRKAEERDRWFEENEGRLSQANRKRIKKWIHDMFWRDFLLYGKLKKDRLGRWKMVW